MRRAFGLLVALVLAAGAVAGLGACGAGETVDRGRERVGDAVDRVRGGDAARRPRRARCPASLAGCRSVRGRVVYVERVDPDGDGDLHVVVAAGSISAPGLTSIDVRPGLRPERDPRVGDWVSAAGQVQRGSIGQPQVHAVVFRTLPA